MFCKFKKTHIIHAFRKTIFLRGRNKDKFASKKIFFYQIEDTFQKIIPVCAKTRTSFKGKFFSNLICSTITTRILKGHWTSTTSSPDFFQKVGIFIPLEVLAWVMTACWVLPSRLIYFWRNMNISSIFYFSKSTSINTQYSSLWDTLKMMLFTKYLTKWKCIGRITWKFWYWFNLKFSIE